MSDIKYYRDLLKQRSRIEAFQRAIANVVRPGDHVLEVGAGLGTFAFFAADAGAAKVWAVEGNPIVHVAKAVALANGYEDRVELVRGWIPSVELPERADLVIFEDFSPRLLEGHTFRLLRWVHERYAATPVRAVPASATFYVAPVSCPKVWQEVSPVDTDDICFGIDWSASREYIVNLPIATTIPAEGIAGAPARLGTVRFDRPPSLTNLRGEARVTVERSCEVHGLAYWFELDLGAGVKLSNAPGAQPGSWGHLFLPVEEPLEIERGAGLTVAIGPHALPDGCPGWLSWELSTGEVQRRGYELAGIPASVADFESQASDYVPELNADGAVEAHVLQLTNGKRSIRDIAQEIRRARTDLAQAEAERLVVAVLRNRIRLAAPVAAGERGRK